MIHKLKNTSRRFSNSEIEAELIAIEVTLGFGSGNQQAPKVSLIEDHQLRILELSELYRNNSENDDSNDEIDTEIDEKPEEIVEELANDGIVLILCNCPGRDAARELAHTLVKARMAACINIIANIGSIYWWEGEIKDTAECQLQIKTAVTPIEDVISFIKHNHPNDVPEILIMPIEQGNEDYFDWVKQESK